MSDDDRESGSEDVGAAGDADSQARISEHLAERGGDDPDLIEDVPAGGGGADAGAGGAARVESPSGDPDAYESTHNDEPGIGARRPGE